MPQASRRRISGNGLRTGHPHGIPTTTTRQSSCRAGGSVVKPHGCHRAALSRRERANHSAVGSQGACAEGLEDQGRSEEHTSELQSLMRISYAVFCLKKKKQHTEKKYETQTTRATEPKQ